ncbi:MAG: DUF6531 domain-containing protein [Candidatus Sulfotelmatobacter sp.]
MGRSQFWNAPLWKWAVVLLLLAFAASLVFRKPSATAAQPIQVELQPFPDSPPAWDGSHPHLVISPVDPESQHVRFNSSILRIKPTVRHDSPTNEFLVDLHSGEFVLRQTDIFIPDVTPLALTRSYRVWDCCVRAFGMGMNHPYDICPNGTRRPYTYMDLNLEDGRQIHFRRISKGTGYADAVFGHDETSSEFYGARIAWNGNGWTLTFRDGRRFFFPEAYYAKSYAQGAPIAMQDADNNRTELKRDQRRNLQQIISPSGRKIGFRYDASDRIVEASDDAGSVRKYTYDSSGHLETVSDASRLLYRFEYAPLLHWNYDNYLMTAVLDGRGRVLLQNFYRDRSRVSEQRLADGEVFRYQYTFDKKNDIVETIVTLPAGTTRKFFFQNGVPAEDE